MTFVAGTVLTAAALNSELAAKTDTAMTQNAQTGTSYSYVLLDAAKLLTMNNASANTVTVTKQATVTWVTGTQLRIMNLGVGVTTLVADTGVTINNNKALTQYSSGTLIRTASDVWTFVPFGGSKILQVVSVIKQDVFSTTATAYTDVTGLSATITPSSASSTILVLVSLSLSNSASGSPAKGAVLRGSTIIGGGTPAGSRTAGSFAQSWTTNAVAIPLQQLTVLDSPASTAATTYKVQIATQTGGTAYVGRGWSGDNDLAEIIRTASTITLMEVAP